MRRGRTVFIDRLNWVYDNSAFLKSAGKLFHTCGRSCKGPVPEAAGGSVDCQCPHVSGMQ